MCSSIHFPTFVAFWLVFVAFVSAVENPPDPPEVKQLLQERLAILTTIYKSRVEAHKSGVMSVGKVLDANAALLQAKLDLCDTKDDRLKVHAEIVELARQTVQVVEELSNAAEAPQSELLTARLRLLEARIGLERAKAGK